MSTCLLEIVWEKAIFHWVERVNLLYKSAELVQLILQQPDQKYST